MAMMRQTPDPNLEEKWKTEGDLYADTKFSRSSQAVNDDFDDQIYYQGRQYYQQVKCPAYPSITSGGYIQQSLDDRPQNYDEYSISPQDTYTTNYQWTNEPVYLPESGSDFSTVSKDSNFSNTPNPCACNKMGNVRQFNENWNTQINRIPRPQESRTDDSYDYYDEQNNSVMLPRGPAPSPPQTQIPQEQAIPAIAMPVSYVYSDSGQVLYQQPCCCNEPGECRQEQKRLVLKDEWTTTPPLAVIPKTSYYFYDNQQLYRVDSEPQFPNIRNESIKSSNSNVITPPHGMMNENNVYNLPMVSTGPTKNETPCAKCNFHRVSKYKQQSPPPPPPAAVPAPSQQHQYLLKTQVHKESSEKEQKEHKPNPIIIICTNTNSRSSVHTIPQVFFDPSPCANVKRGYLIPGSSKMVVNEAHLTPSTLTPLPRGSRHTNPIYYEESHTCNCCKTVKKQT